MDSRRWDSGAVKKGMCGLDLLKDYGETNGRFQRIFRLMKMVLEIVSVTGHVTNGFTINLY